MRALTIGTFDLFHHGHVRLLERAAAFGDLTVGVNSDAFVERYKGRPTVDPVSVRADNVRPWASHVLVNDGPGIDLIRDLRPQLVVIGSDWIGRDYLTQIGTSEGELVTLNVAVVFLPRTPGISTSQLREAA